MDDGLQRVGLVFDIQKFSIHDGPGIRTLVFMKGCPLRCRWCSNPESIAKRPQVMFSAEKCTGCGRCASACPTGVHGMREELSGQPVHVVNRTASCTGCGSCAGECPAGALRVAGRQVTVAQVMDQVLGDRSFYCNSGGGITVGGGEPTSQPEFVKALLAESKREGIHTALETCGYASWKGYGELAPHTDLFLFDLKHIHPERHRELTGVTNERILANLSRLLAAGAAVTVRMPLIRGLNDQKPFLRQALRFLERERKKGGKLRGVELLPYHRLGFTKYGQLGIENPMAGILPHDEGKLERIEAFLRTFDLPVKMVRI